MRRSLLILLFVLFSFLEICVGEEKSTKTNDKPGYKPGLKSVHQGLSETDTKIIKMMETLELIEIVENMDMLKDLDILTEEKKDEKND